MDSQLFGDGRRLTDNCMDVQYSCLICSLVALSGQERQGDNMSRDKSPLLPCAGTVVLYRGRSSKSERNVRVLAEASGGRMVVEAIGRQGVPVRLTIKQENLQPMQPGLFD